MSAVPIPNSILEPKSLNQTGYRIIEVFNAKRIALHEEKMIDLHIQNFVLGVITGSFATPMILSASISIFPLAITAICIAKLSHQLFQVYKKEETYNLKSEEAGRSFSELVLRMSESQSCQQGVEEFVFNALKTNSLASKYKYTSEIETFVLETENSISTVLSSGDDFWFSETMAQKELFKASLVVIAGFLSGAAIKALAIYYRTQPTTA